MKIPTSLHIDFNHDDSIEAGTHLRGTVHLGNPCTAHGHPTFKLMSGPPMIPPGPHHKPETSKLQEQESGSLKAVVALTFSGFEKIKTRRPRREGGRGYETFVDECRLVRQEQQIPLTITGSSQTIDFSFHIPSDLPSTISRHSICFQGPYDGECSIQYQLQSSLERPDGTTIIAKASRSVRVRKKAPEAVDTSLSLSISPYIDTQNYICGFIHFSTSKTFELKLAKPMEYLALHSKQGIQICFQNPGGVGIDQHRLMVKLKQTIRFRAQKTETDLHFDTWVMKVDPNADGVVSIPAASYLRPSYDGKLSLFSHELFVYFQDPNCKSNNVVATTQPIPVILHEAVNGV